MDKRSTRSFAFGLLISAILLLLFQQFFNSDVEKNKHATLKQIEQKEEEISKLKEEITQWQTKYDDLVAAEANEKDDQEKAKIKEYILTISEGMSSKDISSELEKEEIISDAKAFNDFLGERKLQRNIQIGEYKLNNEMTLEQIAKAITKES